MTIEISKINYRRSLFSNFNLQLLLALGILLSNTKLQAEQKNPKEKESNTAISVEFLEFIAEFEQEDDETFELILQHGIQDYERENEKAKSDDENISIPQKSKQEEKDD